MLLQGKTAFITGAARGIGEAIALTFAREGADVVVHYYAHKSDPEKSLRAEAESVAAKIRDTGRKAYLCGFDISDREMADAELKKLLAEVTPNILINNAGITADNLAMRMKPEEWERVIAVNLSGAFWVTQALMRPLMKNGGCIVNIASVIGQMGNIGQANYAASKAGLIGMTKALARELASKKVRVNAIAPGFIETAMTHAMPEEAKKALMDIVPLKETGKPEDIANAALFLCSDMARYITGEVLKVNGGMYM